MNVDSMYDDSYIRMNAINKKIPYITTITAALAAAEKNPDSSEEEQARMNFAIKAHHRKIQQLQQLIAASK